MEHLDTFPFRNVLHPHYNPWDAFNGQPSNVHVCDVCPTFDQSRPITGSAPEISTEKTLGHCTAHASTGAQANVQTPSLSEGRWQTVKDRFRELYISSDMTLSQAMDIMAKEHGFYTTYVQTSLLLLTHDFRTKQRLSYSCPFCTFSLCSRI